MTISASRFSAALLGASFLLSAAPALAGGGCETCYRHVVQPPVYGSVAERVMVRAPHTVHRHVPPAYETVAERVLVSPARKVWQVTRGPHGEPVGCWVMVPARYAVEHRQVMVRPPEVVPYAVPGVYATRHRQVMVQPGYAGWQPLGRSGGYAPGGGDGEGYGYGARGYGSGYGGRHGGGRGGRHGGSYGMSGSLVGAAGSFAGGVVGASAGFAGGVTGGFDGGEY